MKNLHEFQLQEKENRKKAHATKEGEGADDKKYIALMSEYKQLRRTDTAEANKLLEKILKLGKDGDVSKKAKIAAAYI